MIGGGDIGGGDIGGGDIGGGDIGGGDIGVGYNGKKVLSVDVNRYSTTPLLRTLSFGPFVVLVYTCLTKTHLSSVFLSFR